MASNILLKIGQKLRIFVTFLTSVQKSLIIFPKLCIISSKSYLFISIELFQSSNHHFVLINNHFWYLYGFKLSPKSPKKYVTTEITYFSI